MLDAHFLELNDMRKIANYSAIISIYCKNKTVKVEIFRNETRSSFAFPIRTHFSSPLPLIHNGKKQMKEYMITKHIYQKTTQKNKTMFVCSLSCCSRSNCMIHTSLDNTLFTEPFIIKYTRIRPRSIEVTRILLHLRHAYIYVK